MPTRTAERSRSMNHHDTRHIRAERRRDPQAYAADGHQRATEAAEDTLWHIVHDGDTAGIDALMQRLYDTYRTSDADLLNRVLIDALAGVKERDESAAGQLWDRLVEIIKETKA